MQIQNQLLLFNPHSVSEANQRAILIEQNLKSPSSWSGSNPRAHSSLPVDVTTGVGVDTNLENTTTARTTDPIGGTVQPRNTRPIGFKCFNCGDPGHRQSTCPKRVLLGEGAPIYDEYDDEPTPLAIEEQVSGDVGSLLILRRIFLAPREVEEHWSRSNIFQTTCTIQGKVCHAPTLYPKKRFPSSLCSPNRIQDPTSSYGLTLKPTFKSLGVVVYRSPLVQVIEI